MYTYGPLIAKNARSGRLLGGAPVQVTALDGTPLSTAPAGLVTNHEGYLPAFTVDTDQVTVMARPRGGDPLPLHAHEGIQGAAQVADTINTGRLSEPELAATFLPKTDTGATGLALLAAALPADAREALDITIDETVGTRVMVGGVMIYYDSGPRDVSSLLGPDFALSVSVPRLMIQRVNDVVTLWGRIGAGPALAGQSRATRAFLLSGDVPSGFAPINSYWYSVLGTAYLPTGPLAITNLSTVTRIDIRYGEGQWVEGEPISFAARWDAGALPSTLPGLPA